MKGIEEQPERADVREELQRKKEMLERYVRNLPGPVMVAFSGGVDSSLLLAAGRPPIPFRQVRLPVKRRRKERFMLPRFTPACIRFRMRAWRHG